MQPVTKQTGKAFIGNCEQVWDAERRKEELSLDLQAQRAELEQAKDRTGEALREHDTLTKQLQTECTALQQKVGP